MSAHPIRHPIDWVCPECGNKDAKYYAKGLCGKCYQRRLMRARGVKPAVCYKGTKCIECGAEPVKAKGMCDKCYRKSLPSFSSDTRNAQKYNANQKNHFGGRRDEILARAGGRCEMCGMTDEESRQKEGRGLDIHHRDGRGRTSGSPNHADDNLMVLCRRCHSTIHHPTKGERKAS